MGGMSMGIGVGSSISPGSEDQDDLLLKVRECLRECKTHQQEWREQAEEDYAFVAGDQWSEEDVSKLREQNRPAITFNRCEVIVSSVAGYEVSNRQEVRYIPRQMGDAGVNEVLTSAADWVRDQCDAEDEESDAFWDTVVCGEGWTETHLSYEEEPDGKILIERVDPLEMWWDPSSRKRNHDDARYLIREKLVDKADAEKLWPDQIKNLQLASSSAEPEGSPQVVIPGQSYSGENKTPDEPLKNKYRILEYQWFETVKMWRVVNPTSGRVEEVDGSTYDTLAKRIEEQGSDPLKAARKSVKVYHRAFICGDTILEQGELYPQPNGRAKSCQGFTYKAITGKRDRNKGTWYGLVRSMKDPQRWANKWLSQILHIINSNAKGGVMAEKDAVPNIADFENKWARPDAVTWVNPGALASGKLQPKAPVAWPTGLEHLMQFAISSIRDATGVNLEILGMADREQAASLEYQRKQAAIVVLATLFDSLRRYRKEQGRLLLYLIREYISDGRLIKLVQEGMERYVPLVKQPDVETYDVIVDEAASSPNQKEKTWGILQGLMPQMMKMPLPPGVWQEIMKHSPLPESFSQKMSQIIAQHEQQQKGQVPPEVKAKMQELELKKQEAQVDAQISAQKMQQDMELKRQSAAADAMIEQQKAEQQMALEKFKVEAQLALESARMQHQTRMDAEKHQHGMDLEAHKAMMDTGNEGASPKAGKAVSMTPMRDMINAIAQIGQSQNAATETQSAATQLMAEAIAKNSEATLALAKAVTAPRRTTVERDKKTGRATASVSQVMQ